MAGKTIMLVLMAILMAASLPISIGQTTHVVGDALGWTIPPGGPVAYNNWSTNQTFTVGDSLVFHFMPGVHDVVQVTKLEYDTCNTSNPMSSYSKSPVTILLDTEGDKYFICSFKGHCILGQKLMVNVVGAVDSSFAAPMPSSSNNLPSSSGATSVGVAASFLMTFVSTLVALFCY